MGILVRATAAGYYGTLRDVGDQFEVTDEKAVGSWMERVKEDEAKPKSRKLKAEAADDSGAEAPDDLA